MVDAVREAPDPFELWRNWLTESERQWNSFMNDAMATDEFGQSLGRLMNSYLASQKTVSEVVGRYLAAVNLPSRTDIVGLGRRLSDIEERLASIETALGALRGDGGEQRQDHADQGEFPRPPRTKKPDAS